MDCILQRWETDALCFCPLPSLVYFTRCPFQQQHHTNMSSPTQTTKNDSAVEAAGTAAAAVATAAATAAATSKANANGIHVQRVGQQMFPKLMNATLFVLLLLCCRVQLYVAAAGTELTGNHATRSATKEFQEFCTSKADNYTSFTLILSTCRKRGKLS